MINNLHDLIDSFLQASGPIGGFLLIGGIVVIMIEIEQLIQYIVRRIKEDCNRRKKH